MRYALFEGSLTLTFLPSSFLPYCLTLQQATCSGEHGAPPHDATGAASSLKRTASCCYQRGVLPLAHDVLPLARGVLLLPARRPPCRARHSPCRALCAARCRCAAQRKEGSSFNGLRLDIRMLVFGLCTSAKNSGKVPCSRMLSSYRHQHLLSTTVQKNQQTYPTVPSVLVNTNLTERKSVVPAS